MYDRPEEVCLCEFVMKTQTTKQSLCFNDKQNLKIEVSLPNQMGGAKQINKKTELHEKKQEDSDRGHLWLTI